MATKTNGILTKANINAMGPITSWSSNTNECVSYNDLYSSSLMNVKVNQDDIGNFAGVNETITEDGVTLTRLNYKLVRQDKVTPHFTKKYGKVTLKFSNTYGSEVALGDFKITIKFPTTIKVKHGSLYNYKWANTTSAVLNYNYPTAISISKKQSEWYGGGSSFNSFGNGTTLTISSTTPNQEWFLIDNPQQCSGLLSIELDGVTNENVRFVIGSTVFQYTSGSTSGTYKHTYSINNSSMLSKYTQLRDQNLIISIKVEDEASYI